MTVRAATPDDIERVMDLGVQFHAYSPHRDLPFDPEAFGAFAIAMIGDGGIFLSGDGFAGGVLTGLYFSPQTIVCSELFWYAPTGGRELREALEAWARAGGATHIQFSALVDEHEAAIERIYRKAGYHRTETLYLKRL